MKRLYKGKYLICVYAPAYEGETLLALCQDVAEFAELTGASRKVAHVILCQMANGTRPNRIRLFGRPCAVEFVEEGEDEKED